MTWQDFPLKRKLYYYLLCHFMCTVCVYLSFVMCLFLILIPGLLHFVGAILTI